MIKKSETLTYVSLFSCAGVGCYGFKKEGFECVATNELEPRRLEVQKFNAKCRFDSGYIGGDITLDVTKQLIYDEIERWQKLGNDRVDVIVATPPCQGISATNHKKNEHDVQRNSLVIESVEIVKKTKPRIFVFENVLGFQKTLCVPDDDKPVAIGDLVRRELGADYIINGRVLNFMNFGSNSSRTRTLMIGVDRNLRNTIVPYDLFPDFTATKTLRDVIGGMEGLGWGEISSKDFYHAFRTYPQNMRAWIHDLKEGESAFDNENPVLRPHKIVGGVRIENIKKNRDKYTRQLWDRFVQCVQTRNDQLAAQNTIHPVEDRVFSIRELMRMMTIPEDFKWVPYTLRELNELPENEKRRLYKQHETNIRQCIGEAVPTQIFVEIAKRVKGALTPGVSLPNDINKFIESNDLSSSEKLYQFVESNKDGYSIFDLMRIAELANCRREQTEAFYTNKFMTDLTMDCLPNFSQKVVRILEPSVGVGSFLPFLFKRYADIERVELDVVDIDPESIRLLRALLTKIRIPRNFKIRFICADFLRFDFSKRYDLVVGNPPYAKIKRIAGYEEVLLLNHNTNTKDLAELFLEKCLRLADFVALVMNKTILTTDEYALTRKLLSGMRINSILDFGRYGFTGVSIETMCLMVEPRRKPSYVFIFNMKHNLWLRQKQEYITDTSFPYFIIYRNDDFDKVASKMLFGKFDVVRDRQITKNNSTKEPSGSTMRVVKARNIDDAGNIISIADYDTYIEKSIVKDLSVSKFVGDESVYLSPNMTYNPRVIRNRPGIIPDGSVAVLIPKEPMNLTDYQLNYFASDEYRKFYAIARNLSTQSINIDKTSVFFFGVVQ